MYWHNPAPCASSGCSNLSAHRIKSKPTRAIPKPLAPDELKAVHPLGNPRYRRRRIRAQRKRRDYRLPDSNLRRRTLHARTRQPRLLALPTLAALCRRFADALAFARAGVPQNRKRPMPFFVKPVARKISGNVKTALSNRKPPCILPMSKTN